MSITKDDVMRVADLARLALTPQESDLYTDQLQRILKHVEKLSELNTDGIVPTTYTVPPTSVFRDDVVADSLGQDLSTSNAPLREKGCFKVPKIIE
ncbi:MAG: Asp-tRNA(Asn)/Glu-tRNA(Gln) amidotransferase subunit GatC [Deltaproteobacteria bacterium]